MDVDELGNAAALADSLSTYRHKKIRLVVSPHGISIDGVLIRPDGVIMQEFAAEQPWAEIEGKAGALEHAVQRMNRRLVAEWGNMELIDEDH